MEWIRDCEHDVAIPLDGSGFGIVIVTPAEFDDFTRPTIVRIRGHLQLHMTDVTLGNNALVTYGITIVNPGEPSPNPFAERRGNRWLYWGCAWLVNPPGASLALADGINFRTFEFDVKSMRKRMVDQSSLQFCLTTEGPAGVSATVGTSVLVKE